MNLAAHKGIGNVYTIYIHIYIYIMYYLFRLMYLYMYIYIYRYIYIYICASLSGLSGLRGCFIWGLRASKA